MREWKPDPKPEPKKKKDKLSQWKELSIRAGKKMLENNKHKWAKDTAFFEEIWMERIHYCEKCHAPINHFAKWNFHHIKPKAKFPKLRYDKDNIMILCLQCHSQQHS
jgi:HNH endonuclease.